jgi:hypothetical protein
MTQDQHSIYCTGCGMPLAYDYFVASDQTSRSTQLCSYCRETHNKSDRNDGHNAWVLDEIFKIYRSKISAKRPLANLALSIKRILPEKLVNLAQVINSIPAKSVGSTYDALVLYSGGKDSSYMLINLARGN